MTTSIRHSDEKGQMLVAVIVLLALMFFIGSAMALAVSSSLHTIAQTNTMDSSSYAAESAVAEGLAVNRLTTAPKIDHVGGAGNTKWAYTYEVVGGGRLLGRSAEAVDTQGIDNVGPDNHENITIDPNPAGADHFELYRSRGGPSLGYLGTFVADVGNGFTVIKDLNGDRPLDAKPSPPMCTSPSLSSLPKKSNNYPLTATTCRVPADDSTPIHMWSGAEQRLGAGKCLTQAIGLDSGSEPATLWGVIGWHSRTPTPANLTLSVQQSAEDSCAKDVSKCSVRTTPGQRDGVLYYWCNLGAETTTQNLHIVNQGGDADLSAFVVRGASSGTDCVVTVAGQAGPVADEADSRLTACNWDGLKQTLWNRVLS